MPTREPRTMTLARGARLAASLVLLGAPSTVRADPEIREPADGDVVDSPLTVKVSVDDLESCDTDGCSQVPPENIELFADSESLASCSPGTSCSDYAAEFEVELAPGEHRLTALASGFNSASEWSAPVTITVEEPPSACGCRTASDAGVGLLVLAVAVAARRRRPLTRSSAES